MNTTTYGRPDILVGVAYEMAGFWHWPETSLMFSSPLTRAYQQNITEADVAVVVLVARTNDITDLQPLVPELLNRLNDLKRGEIVRIEAGQNEESPPDKNEVKTQEL